MQKVFVAPADLVPPLRAHHGQKKILFSQILYLKVFAELWRESSPPEARVLPDKLPQGIDTFGMQNFKAKGAVLAPFAVV